MVSPKPSSLPQNRSCQPEIDEVDGKKTQACLLKSVMSKFEPMSDSELGSFPLKDDCWYGTPYFGLERRGALSERRCFMSQSQPIPITREGFRLERDRFTLPKDTATLDPKSKRAITICNLFVNHKLPL